MLGFSSISELALAQLPSTFVPIAGQAVTSALGSEGVTGTAEITLTVSLAGTTALGTLSSVTGTANVSITGFSATLSAGDVILWGLVLPGVTTTYSNVNTSNSPTWSTVSTGASQTWTEKVA